MKHIMIDIETLDSTPTAVILSIAAVVFDPHSGKYFDIPFHAHCHIDHQISDGRSISQSTLFWWLNQDEAAQKAITNENRIHIEIALMQLDEWLQKYKDSWVWANSPSFDLQILENAWAQYKTDDGKLFSKHWLQRDVRTLKQYISFEDFDWPGATAHDAISDCYDQVAIVHAFYKQYGISKEE